MTASPPHLAVIGAGHLGRIHAQLAAGQNAFNLVAVIDPDREAGDRLAATTTAESFTDLTEAWGKFDAAILATPTSLHHAIGLQLLERGIPVLIEKPIAATSAEARQLVAAATEARTVLQVGHVERFNPAFATIARTLDDVRCIESRRWSGFPFRSLDVGVVLDLMIHDLDLVLAIVDADVVDVRATGTVVMGGEEDMASARIEFANGCVAQLSASRVSAERQRIMNIVAGDRYHTLDFATGRTTSIVPSERLRRGQLAVDALPAKERERLQANFFTDVLVKTEHEHPAVNAILEEQFEFAAALEGAVSPRVAGADGYAAVALAEVILERIADTRPMDRRDPHAASGIAPSDKRPILPLPRATDPLRVRRAG